MSAPHAAPCLRLDALGKDFGTTRALDTVDLDIAEGELFCLLGGSGCGKSTLLRVVAGLEAPSRGRVLIDGRDVSAVPPWQRPVNLVFQSYALFPHLSVAANVAFGLRQENMPRAAIARRVADMLGLVRLEHLADRRPRQLSGGQRQRVALARALVKQPRLLLLDEPLAALDRQLRETTRLELVRIQRELGTTFVMVTHDQEEALSLATRIGVMADGRLLQSGAPHDVYERPANRFVAEFVGNANLLEVDVTTHDDAGVLLGSDLCSTPLRAAAASATRAGRAWLLLRPEQVTLAHADVPTAGVGDNALAGVIEDIAYGGDRWVYAIRLANGVRWRVSEPNAAHRAHADLTRGVAVTLRWPPGCGVVLAQ